MSIMVFFLFFFFFSSRRRHTRFDCDWSSDVCSSDLELPARQGRRGRGHDPRPTLPGGDPRAGRPGARLPGAPADFGRRPRGERAPAPHPRRAALAAAAAALPQLLFELPRAPRERVALRREAPDLLLEHRALLER